MPCVKHKARPLVRCLLNEAHGERGVAKGQSRPPEIFIEQHTLLRQRRDELAHNLDRPLDDIPVVVEKIARKDLALPRVRDVKNGVLRPARSRDAEVITKARQPLLARVAEDAAHLLWCIIARKQLLVAAPKMHPRGVKPQMNAAHDAPGEKPRVLRIADHKLNAVKPVALQKRLHALRRSARQIADVAVRT